MPSRKPLKYVSCLTLACVVALLAALPVFGQTATVTMVGAGDIAECGSNRDEATAKLLGRIRGTVFTLGDNVQGRGTTREFTDCYAPFWGKYKKRTKPSAGNHEYYTAGAKPYYNYFGARAGSPNRGYYSYDRGGWHVVVLNSNCDKVGGCGLRSPQGRWLRNDLRNNPSRCTLAYFHHPLFSSGSGETSVARPFWRILYAQGADVILSGHSMSYERFAPQTPDGKLDRDKGIREFVAGTGGSPPLNPFGPRPANSQVRNDKTRGVLKLNLNPGSYSWKFVPVAGKTFTDSGTDRCH